MLVRRPRILTLCMTSALCLSGASSEGARQLGRAVAIGAIRALLRQIHNRGRHTINPELLISGLRAGMSVILGESWRCFFCAPYADTQGQERAAGTYRPQGIQSVPDVEDGVTTPNVKNSTLSARDRLRVVCRSNRMELAKGAAATAWMSALGCWRQLKQRGSRSVNAGRLVRTDPALRLTAVNSKWP